MPDKPSNADRDFSDSFLWCVPLREGRAHSWKHHGRKGTLVREVLGFLDLLANRDPQRFVFASLAAILKNCNKGKRAEGKRYTKRHLKFVMAELCARHIISRYFERWDGRYGFVMEPHDFRTSRDGNVCVKHAPKRFECSPEEAEWRAAEFPTYSPPVHRLFTEQFTACSPPCSPAGSQKFTDLFTKEFTDELEQVYKSPELTEALCEKWLADGEQTGAPNRISRLAVEPKNRRTGLAAKPNQKQEPPQKQKPPQRSSVRRCPTTPCGFVVGMRSPTMRSLLAEV